MTTKYITYPLKENDSLESVAKELCVDIEYLILVHNLNVEISDKIKGLREGFPSHLTEIFIHQETNDALIERKNEKRPKNNPLLRYKPIKEKKTYNVFYTILDGQQQHKISFQTSIEAVKEESNINGHIVEINKLMPLYINNEDPKLVIDSLAIETAKAIYPLQIILNYNGEFVDIKNHKEIVKRWEEIVKEKINTNFESQQTQQYLSWAQETLINKEQLILSLKKDWFLNTFFSGIYTNYHFDYQIKNVLLFPINPAIEKVEYVVVNKMNKYADDQHQMTINQVGKVDDSMYANNPDLVPISGEYEAEYLLDPKDNSIKKVTLHCSLDFIKAKKVVIDIALS
jgi:hypothetical protein